MHFRRTHSWPSVPRRLLAAAVLGAYLAAALGLPLPPPVLVKDGGKPFPCQGHVCGCQTAEECWRHCCCFTAAERWAWAEANGVQPPDYAEKPAADDPCATAVCEKCEDEHAGCPHCHRDECASSRTASHPAPFGRLAVAPLSCRGQTAQWATTGAVPAPAPVRPDRSSPVVAERLAHGDVLPRRLTQTPPLPPPRTSFLV